MPYTLMKFRRRALFAAIIVFAISSYVGSYYYCIRRMNVLYIVGLKKGNSSAACKKIRVYGAC